MGKGVLLEYYDGLISKDEIEKLETDMNGIELELHLYDKSKIIFNSLEDFTSSIILHLNNEVVQAYILGLFTNASFEILKTIIVKLIDKVQSKKLTVLQSGEVRTEDVTFGIKMKINDFNSLDIRLSGDYDDIDKYQVIEKAFQLAEKTIKKYPDNIKSDLFAYHDNGEWKVCNINDEIRKKVYKNKVE